MTLKTTRRYDIDWLRVIAIFLLMFYHSAIIFQPFAKYFGFIQSPDYLLTLWKALSAVNIWRIPLLFFVAGMGVYFSMARRDWKQLIKERALRIGLPLLFGSFMIVPIHMTIFMKDSLTPLVYLPNPGHLWFLANILIYLVVLIPIFYWLRGQVDSTRYQRIQRIAQHPFIVYLLASPIILEAWLVDPEYFSEFAGTVHGFWIGLVAFFAGFSFVLLGEVCFETLSKYKFAHLLIALVLYIFRLNSQPNNVVIAIEAICWLFAAFGFAYRYLNFSNRALVYLNEAVFPVYIIHMALLFSCAYFIVYLEFSGWLKFTLVVVTTVVSSLGIYELVIKRVRLLRPLFGLRISSK